MQQHTAGPYQVGQYEGQFGIYADNVKIATVEAWIGETERAESEANASLIAAAPDLLAALKDALSCLENLQQVQQWHADDGDHIEEACVVLGTMKSAIAQAQGVKP